MTTIQEKSPIRYPRRNAAEDRAWRRLYRDAGDPGVAEEIVQALDDEARRSHLALYLRCRNTLRKQAARSVAQARIASVIKMFAQKLAAALSLRRRHPIPLRAARDAACYAFESEFFAFGGESAEEQRRSSTTSSIFLRHGLRAIENAGSRANLVQLKAYLACVRLNRIALHGEERCEAEAVIGKLEARLRQLLVEQILHDGAGMNRCPAPAKGSFSRPGPIRTRMST
jgi:hypothetical protein